MAIGNLRVKPFLFVLTAVLSLLIVFAIVFVAVSPTRAGAAGGTPNANNLSKTVTITTINGTFAFSPKTLKITVGTTVVWKNTTQVDHTATSNDGKTFNSGIIAPGGTFKFTFKKAGTFAYHCQIHPFMKATIIVS